MPPLTPAQRMQGAAAPAKRNRWDCRLCNAHGWGENATAARVAGERHFLDTHDDPGSTTTSEGHHA